MKSIDSGQSRTRNKDKPYLRGARLGCADKPAKPSNIPVDRVIFDEIDHMRRRERVRNGSTEL